MNRRGFLTALTTLGAGLTLDPERLLWVPGKVFSFASPAPVFFGPSFAEVMQVSREVLMPGILEYLNRASPLLLALERGALPLMVHDVGPQPSAWIEV